MDIYSNPILKFGDKQGEDLKKILPQLVIFILLDWLNLVLLYNLCVVSLSKRVVLSL
jgi:hypothetical protein